MNAFDKKIAESGHYPLRADDITTLQVNLGYRCNLRCSHCHVEASPERREEMSASTFDLIIDILKNHKAITTVDITGGSPELSPHYVKLIRAASDAGKQAIVRSNLAVLSEPGMEGIPSLWADRKVKVVASLPCYTEEGVDSQRGRGTYKKAIAAFRHLNSRGYGREGTGLEIDIMFNPARAEIAPDQQALENAYREKLMEMHGVRFNHLIALSNMPIGRLGRSMSDYEKKEYISHLEEKYNPMTVKNLMCRHLISVGPDGNIYDCDFWQMLKMPVKNRKSNDVESFDYEQLREREIMTTPLCFMCTAGAGASCSGALT